MKKLNFVSSFINHSNQYLTWLKYAENIYGINKKIFEHENIKPIVCPPFNIYNKETYSIKHIIDETRKISNKFILLNSDIEIDENNDIWEKILSVPDDALVIGNRFNYNETYSDSKINLNGIDFFLINQNLQIPQDYTFCIGLCSWDWWLPFLATQQKITIFKINCPFIYHKKHKKNWCNLSFKEMEKHFAKITGYNNNNYKYEILKKAKEII